MSVKVTGGVGFSGGDARRGLRLVVVAALLLPLSFAWSTWAAPAARPVLTAPPTFTVNTPSDAPAAGPLDDGHCATAYNNGVPNGVCTLRAAIMKANHWPGAGAIIILPALPPSGQYSLTIPKFGADDETTGDLNITATVSLRGGGSSNTIIYDNSGLTNDRVFSIGAGVAVSMTGVTIQGGAAAVGGGVFSAGTLTLDHSAVISNTSNDLFQGGGGIDNDGGVLTVTSSLISGNYADNFVGGGLRNKNGVVTIIGSTIAGNSASSEGGGIQNTAFATIAVYSSTVVGNASNLSFGGGIANEYGSTTLVATTVSANSSADGGGGIADVAGTMTLVATTVDSNTTTAAGGGLEESGGTTNLVNSTVSGNNADGDGGGIWNSAAGTVKLFNVTISNNQADADFNGTGVGGGISNTATVNLQNSLLAGNWQTALMSIRVLNDCIGTLTSLDYNLVGYTNGCGFTPSTHDQTNVVADLGPLRDNGGPTWTHALLPGSPAIDAGNPGGCTDNNAGTLATDQRGYPRTANGAGTTRCDIGAFEVQRLLDLPLVRR